MDVVITEWALQSYLNLKYRNVFTSDEYRNAIRPDVELLRDQFPHNPKFKNPGFWGPATDKSGSAITDGYKMKWHNIGPGRVQQAERSCARPTSKTAMRRTSASARS